MRSGRDLLSRALQVAESGADRGRKESWMDPVEEEAKGKEKKKSLPDLVPNRVGDVYFHFFKKNFH